MENAEGKTVYYCSDCRLMASAATECARCGGESFNTNPPPSKSILFTYGKTAYTRINYRINAV